MEALLEPGWDQTGLPPALVAADAETGVVLQTPQTLWGLGIRCVTDHDDVFGLSRGRRALPPIASRGADEFGQIAAEPLGSIDLHGVAHAVVHE